VQVSLHISGNVKTVPKFDLLGYMWPTKFAPSYRMSFVACAIIFAFSIALTFVIRQCLVWENQKLDRIEQEFLAHQQRDEIVKGEGADAIAAGANVTGVGVADQLAMKRGWRYIL